MKPLLAAALVIGSKLFPSDPALSQIKPVDGKCPDGYTLMSGTCIGSNKSGAQKLS